MSFIFVSVQNKTDLLFKIVVFSLKDSMTSIIFNYLLSKLKYNNKTTLKHISHERVRVNRPQCEK